jgi:hypothetical protein
VTSVGELVELAAAYFKRRAPRLISPSVYRRVVHPLLLGATRDERGRRALSRSEVFFPYFEMAVTYDDRRSRVALRGTGIAPTPLPHYFDQLVEFALAAEWGRRPIPRAGLVPPAAAFPYDRLAQVRRAPRVRSARPRPRRVAQGSPAPAGSVQQ